MHIYVMFCLIFILDLVREAKAGTIMDNLKDKVSADKA